MSDDSGRICPVCSYRNEAGANFCLYCGTPLQPTRTGISTAFDLGKDILPDQQITKEFLQKTYPAPAEGVAIYTAESDVPITIQKESQFTLGRKMAGEMDEPFVDLHPFGAYENGVSRRHALIKKTKTGYEITDLGSTNGTWLEKRHLTPNRAYPLDNGSRIYLGRMQLFVIFRKTDGQPELSGS